MTYTPPAGWSGSDAFTVVVDDGYGRLSYSTVTMTVDPGATIGGHVWTDSNHDGLQDANETLIVSGRTVYLLDANNNVVATTTTDTSGDYSFIGILAGQYRIQVDLAPGETFSPEDQGADDGIDSDVDATGKSSLFDVLSTSIKDIDAGLYPVSNGGGG